MRSKPDSEGLRKDLIAQLEQLSDVLKGNDLRVKVLCLVEIQRSLSDLSSSLISEDSARDRILAYLRANVGQVVTSDELRVLSGISEYARRIRELRTEHGWPIISGASRNVNMADDDTVAGVGKDLRVDQYILLEDKQDADVARRWKRANELRNSERGVRDRLIDYFRENVGQRITGEELAYVAGEAKEWARRVRELRTEYGWPIATNFTGRPDLPVGVYVLEEDRQSPPHDRRIPDPERRKALMRDKHTCQDCQWTHDRWNRSDPRHLELHHLKHHADKGENTAENLVTLCNPCHDERHRHDKDGNAS